MDEDEARVERIRSTAGAEKALISELKPTLSYPSAPYMKRQLDQILQSVDDVEKLLRFARDAETRSHSDAWLSLAESNIQAATEIRQRIQKLIDVYGGPQNVREDRGGPQVDGESAA